MKQQLADVSMEVENPAVRHLKDLVLLEVMKRGGWRTYSSLARYEKHTRIGLVLRREPEPPRVHDPRWLATPLT